MKKPSLKDKLLSAAAIEEAHQQLTQKSAPPPPPAKPQPEPKIEASKPQPRVIETPVAASEAPRPQFAAARRGRRNSVEFQPERNVRITVDMPESLHDRVKLHTVLQKQSIRDFILTLIERELARK